ncbi:MAG TPA: hypothetical protein VLL77_00725 [Anaerolineales bacterium]|nr:hypothetical protein [Anaerolineales bacterium]
MAAWVVFLLGRAAAPPAYLDPGSGSYLIQLVLAGALGALLAIRMSWGRIKGMFRRGEPAEDEQPEKHDE